MKFLNTKIVVIFAVITVGVLFYFTKQNKYKNTNNIEINVSSNQSDTIYKFIVDKPKKVLKTKTFVKGKQEIKSKNISEESIKEIYNLASDNTTAKDSLNATIIIKRNASTVGGVKQKVQNKKRAKNRRTTINKGRNAYLLKTVRKTNCTENRYLPLFYCYFLTL